MAKTNNIKNDIFDSFCIVLKKFFNYTPFRTK